ncbi:hypothetical protein [Actinoplanes sp. GCM10030250]|uniref:hypothetical protein n=1 Tax=Actinoplanes sp. GCM10030250 TaxID=3273376 RepID=UPI00360F121D
MITATRELLAVLDPLPHRQRLRHVAAWARTAADRAEVCADLREHGPYERHLALIAAMTSRDTEGIAAASRDPLPALRAVALDAALRAGILTTHDLSAADRRRLYRRVRRLRRPAVADALIRDVLASHGPGEAAAVLPACGAETVRALLPGLEHQVNLAALAHRHAGLVHEWVRDVLAATEPDRRSWIWHRAAPAVLSGDPAAALDLLELYAPEDSLPGSLTAYGKIAAHSPDRVARLLTAPRRVAWLRGLALPPALLRRLAVLSTAALVPLARTIRDRHLPALLAALPPSRRAELHDAAFAGVDTSVRIPPAELMDVLPREVRIREAARVLTLPRIREQEPQAEYWSGYLAWPDAVAALESAIRSGDAGDRARGYGLLVLAAVRSRDPEPVAEVIGRLLRLGNEQDPVRMSALRPLAGAARLLTPAVAGHLATIVTDVTEARDTSAGTTNALARLAAGVLRHHVDEPELLAWALSTIDRVSTSASMPVLHRFDGLRRGQEAMVFARLRPWIEATMSRGSCGPLFAVTRALGRRARNLPELRGLLRRAFEPRVSETDARTAITLWLDDRRGRDDRVAEVLAADPTAVAIPVVWETISARRTDLLDVALARRPRGRFVPAGVRWVPGTITHAERWLPRQQNRMAGLLSLVAEDTEQPVWQRAAAIKAVARIPVAGWEVVLRYADSAEVVLAEAALGALIRTERPDEALPVLLAHVGDDRARVALYAAGRAVAHIPPSRLVASIGPILSTSGAKVTSRKEAVRLLARYGPPEVMETLLAAYRVPDQHRDVRAAIVSAARQHLDSAVSWTIVEAAAGGSREELRAVLVADPRRIAEPHRARYAALIAAACRAPDREIRRAAFQSLPGWAPWSADVTALIVDRFTDLGESLDGVRTGGLMAAAGSGWLHEAFERLAARDAADDLPGRPGDDRPARRRIEALARAALAGPRGEARARLIPEFRGLADQPGYRSVAVITLIGLGRLDDLDTIADLCDGRPVLALRAAQHAGGRLRQLPELIGVDFLHPVASRLTARGDLAGGLLAVELTRLGATFGWGEPWRGMLLGLRDHPDPDVRDEAYAVDMT